MSNVVRPQFRRISRTLHDKCVEAIAHDDALLGDQEVLTLITVAHGWSAGTSVTKADHDAALIILNRLGL